MSDKIQYINKGIISSILVINNKDSISYGIKIRLDLNTKTKESNKNIYIYSNEDAKLIDEDNIYVLHIDPLPYFGKKLNFELDKTFKEIKLMEVYSE